MSIKPVIQSDEMQTMDLLALSKSSGLEDVFAQVENKGEMIPALQVNAVVREFRALLARFAQARRVLSFMHENEEVAFNGRNSDADKELLKDTCSKTADAIKQRILEVINKYGVNLIKEDEAQRDYEQVVTYSPERFFQEPTLANFRYVRSELMRIQRKLQHLQDVLSAMTISMSEQDLYGLEGLRMDIMHSDNDLNKQKRQLEAEHKQLWSDEQVKMAHMRQEHESFIQQIAEGRSILETPTVVKTMNQLHRMLYGSEAYKVTGPVLVGPPGWGKTSMLQDYFRSFGREALSADIDPGQSAFTIMARPVLTRDDRIKQIKGAQDILLNQSDKTLYQMIKGQEERFARVFMLNLRDVKRFVREHKKLKSSADTNEVAQSFRQKIADSFDERLNANYVDMVEAINQNNGYEYLLVLEALLKNQPVILNEFVELQEWTFLHGLLTAVPCSESEAAPEPTNVPSEAGQVQNPKGWFFNTITNRWMRVPEHFRICFTGNIGLDTGQTSVPGAIQSRMRNNIIEVGALPPEEVARCIVWPYLSNPETGELMLSAQDAYKVHFLVTRLFPKLDEQLQNVYDEKVYLSTRLIIDFCRELKDQPKFMRRKVSIDEALMSVIVRSAKALNHKESLKIMVSLMIGAGFLLEYTDEISAMGLELSTERAKQIINDLNDPFDQKEFEQDESKLKEGCPICGVSRCPVHGTDMKAFEEYSDNIQRMSEIGLNMRMVQQLQAFSNKLLETGNIEAFHELYIGDMGQDIAQEILSNEQRIAICGYVNNKLNHVKESDEGLIKFVPSVMVALDKSMILKRELDLEVVKQIESRLIARVANDEDDNDSLEEPIKTYLLIRKLRLRIDKEECEVGVIVPDEIKAEIAKMITTNPSLEMLRMAEEVGAFKEGEILEMLNQNEITNKFKAKVVNNFAKKRVELFKLREYIPMAPQEKFLKPRKSLRRKRNVEYIPIRPMPEGIEQCTFFEQHYPRFIAVLQEARDLVAIKLLDISDIADLLLYVKEIVDRVVEQQVELKFNIPYIRLLQLISEIRGHDLNQSIAMMSRVREVPLPPLRDY